MSAHCWSKFDVECMRLALNQAKKGLYSTFSNPRVGCVVVRNNHVVGKGFHCTDGAVHAEVMALAQAGELAQGATVFLTLEPCNHYGKQPPCTQALIRAGVKRVVYAAVDPNPHVTGKGAATLQQAGIKTQNGLLNDEAKALNQGFYKRACCGLPWVRAKLAISLDGRIAAVDSTSRYISDEPARRQVMQFRATSQAIISASATVLADDPQLTVRKVVSSDDCHDVCCRNQDKKTYCFDVCQTKPICNTFYMQPQLWLIDSLGRIPLTAKVFSQIAATQNRDRVPAGMKANTVPMQDSFRKVVWNTLHNTILDTLPSHIEHRQALSSQRVNAYGYTKATICLRSVLQEMACRGINDVLIESGGGLVGALIHEQLIDELVCFHAPILLGEKGIPMAKLGVSTMKKAISFNLIQHRKVGTNWCSVFVPTNNGHKGNG